MRHWFRKASPAPASPPPAPAQTDTADTADTAHGADGADGADGGAPVDDGSEAHKARGNAFFAEGRLAEAAASFRLAIDARPSHAAALFNLGLVLREQGLLEDAAGAFERAFAADPGMADAAHLQGDIRRQQGDLGAAIAQFRRALAADPAAEAAASDLCLALLQDGQLGAAGEALAQALARHPRSGELHDHQGRLALAQGKPAEAAASFRRALALGWAPPDLHNGLGIALQQLGDPAAALASFEAAVAADPGYADAHINRGAALADLRRHGEALAAADRALALKPDSADAHTNRGLALAELRRYDEALPAFGRALALQGPDAELFNSIGMAHLWLGKGEEALASFGRALAIQPLLGKALGNQATALNLLGRREEALQAYARVLALAPGQDFAPGQLLAARMHACEWAGLQALIEQNAQATRAGRLAISPFAWLAACDSQELQWLCSRGYQQALYPTSPAPMWRGERYAHDRIRVAYLSADLHQHATAFLAAGLFERHDAARFEVVALAFGPHKTGEMRTRLERAFSRFIEVGDKDDAQVARMMREMEIDIAVDLGGYTRDARAGIFTHRAAPVQVSYLGYPGTLAAEHIDYIVADPRVIEPQDERWYTEKVVYLPDSYQVNDDRRRIAAGTPARAEQGLPPEGFVFCCFNNNYKILPPVFDAWMRLLQAVPGSVLWLLEDNPLAVRNLRAEAARRGVPEDRLVFAPRAPLDAHLARHRLADLFLDTQPYNAHTTASDALWAGLPVLTCRGASFASRVASSLLHAVGLPELVTHSLADYEALALALATNPARLAGLRARLAANRLSAPLFDTDRFRRHLEAAYTAMWARSQRGEAPASFRVEPLT